MARTNNLSKKNANNKRDCEENYSLNDFMKEFRGRFDNQEKKLDKNHIKLSNLSAKMGKIEERSSKMEKDTKEKLVKIREEITTGLNDLEVKVTENVVTHLKPKIQEIQTQAKDDIQNTVKEEIKNINIPTLIHEEVKSAMEKLRKEAEDKEDEDEGEP